MHCWLHMELFLKFFSTTFWCCAGKVEECKKFFETLYKFVYLLGTYVKPNVSIQSLRNFVC